MLKLKVEDIYQLELAKFMYRLHYNQLLKNFITLHEMNTIHQHETRLINLTAYYHPQVNKLFCKKLFCHIGSKQWDDLRLELKSMDWVSFKKPYEVKLLKDFDSCKNIGLCKIHDYYCLSFLYIL